MKNYEEFRNAVFEKAAAYEKQKRSKRQKALRIALSVSLCLAVFIAVTAVPFGLILGNLEEANSADKSPSNVTDNKLTSLTNTEVATTAATTCATTCATTAAATQTTTAAFTYESTMATFTPTAASTTYVSTTAAYTYATTTTAGFTYASSTAALTTSSAATTTTTTFAPTAAFTTTALSTTGPIFPEQLLGDYYHNGVMTLHLGTRYEYSESYSLSSAKAVLSYNDLSAEEAKYFDEDYFEKNALIRIKYTLGNIGYRLDYNGLQIDGGNITVFLELDSSQSVEKQACIEWELLICIPREFADDKTIITEIE